MSNAYGVKFDLIWIIKAQFFLHELYLEILYLETMASSLMLFLGLPSISSIKAVIPKYCPPRGFLRPTPGP